MFRTTMLATATASILAALTLTACGVDTTTRPAPAAAAPAAANSDKAQLTRAAFSLTWADVSETERSTLCDSLLLLGPQGAATAMGGGPSGDPSLDWDLMVDLLETECDAR